MYIHTWSAHSKAQYQIINKNPKNPCFVQIFPYLDICCSLQSNWFSRKQFTWKIISPRTLKKVHNFPLERLPNNTNSYFEKHFWKHAFKILRCEYRKVFKVYLAALQHYPFQFQPHKMVKHTQTIRRRIVSVCLTILWDWHLKDYVWKG